jgi:ankyrin repeat protein
MFIIAGLLLDNGAIPDCIERGHSHLCFSTEKGFRYAELLLNKGADPNIMCNDESRPHQRCNYGGALSRAAHNGDIITLKALIERGAVVDPEITGDDFGSPLVAAVSSGKLDYANLLVEKGAKVDAILKSGRYGSPLAAAASSGRLDCIRFLVESGAKINTRSKRGRYGSPMVAVVVIASSDCVRFIVQEGADVNAYLEFGDYGSALAAAVLAYGHTVKMVQFLIEEQHANLTTMHVYQPRKIRVRGCVCGGGLAMWQLI